MSTTEQNPPADSAPRNAGDTIAGCYVLSRRLQVADGVDVWLAQDEVLGKDVSLHFIPQSIGKDSKALQELRLDIKRNRQLIHPNILRVYDLVEEPEFAAVSMDTFEGDSLSRKIGQGAIPAAEVQPWAAQLATTLEAAHKINVLHRDLSPANLFLTPSGKLLVANFGISRTVHDALVRAGGAGSGDAFASPQLREGAAAGRADDIYAFGAILFSALTGQSPAAASDVTAALQAVQAPANWISLISACLNASPDARPQTAAELTRQLSAAPAPAAASVASAVAPAAVVETPAPAAVSAPAPVAPVVEEKPAEAPAPVPELKLATPPPPPQPEPIEPTPTPVVETPAPAIAAVAAAAAVTAEAAPAPVAPAPLSPADDTPAAPVETPKVVDTPKEVETPAPAPVVSEPVKPVESVAPAPTPEPELEHEPVVSITKPVEPVVELKPAAAAAPAPVVESKAASTPAVEPSSPAREVSPSSAESPAPLRPWDGPAKEPIKEPKKTESSRPSSALTAPRGPARRGAENLSAPHYPEESRFPVTTLAAAAAVIVVIAIIYHFTKSGNDNVAANPAAQQPEKAELRPPSSTPVATPASDGPVVQTKPVAVAATPTPRPATPTPAPTPGQNVKAVAERTAMLEKAKAEAETAEKNYAALQKQQQEAEAGVAEIQKSIGEKTASVKTLKKAADEVAVQRKKLEDDKKAADTAAAEAQKAANEKVRLAEISAKALLDMEQVNAEKIAAPEKAEKEIADLQKTLEEKQRSIADQAKAVTQAETARQQQLATIAEHQREIDRIKSTDAEAQKQKDAAAAAAAASAEAQKQKDAAAAAAAAADAQKQKDAAAMAATQKEKDAASTEKSKIDSELAEMQNAFKQKMAELEAKRKQLENPAAAPAPATPVPAPNVSVRATPAPATPAPVTVIATPAPAPSTPIKMSPAATPSVAPTMAALTTPAPIVPSQGTPLVTTNANTAAAPVTGGNSLGMKFVPVGDVDFCIWQTRLKDFEVFAKAVNLRSNSWKGPGFKQGPEHPVVNVSWTEAVAFCKWLTDKEHKEETLPANQFYRLPTDLEWSRAVGLPEETGKTPELRDMGVPDVYPWGTAWPPPQGAGNYTGEETGSDVAIKGYDDGFAWTAPVGSFPPNKFGIYDMGGNVWQWCMDTWNADSKAKVLRGASWYNGALKLSLLSSCRVHAAPDSSTDNYGFRIVRAKEDGKASRR